MEDVDPRVERLREWFLSKGGLLENVDISPDGHGGMGVFISGGEGAAPRIVVPRECIPGGGPLSHLSAVEAVLSDASPWSEALPGRPGPIGLVEAAAAEMAREARESGGEPLPAWPEIDRHADDSALSEMRTLLLRVLDGTPIRPHLSRRVNEIISHTEMIGRKGGDAPSVSRVCWAHCVVSSRSFSPSFADLTALHLARGDQASMPDVDDDLGVLVPVMDLINHHHGCGSSFATRTDGSVEYLHSPVETGGKRPREEINAGASSNASSNASSACSNSSGAQNGGSKSTEGKEAGKEEGKEEGDGKEGGKRVEAFVSYGPFGNEVLLRQYGFALGDNAGDAVEVEIGAFGAWGGSGGGKERINGIVRRLGNWAGLTAVGAVYARLAPATLRDVLCLMALLGDNATTEGDLEAFAEARGGRGNNKGLNSAVAGDDDAEGFRLRINPATYAVALRQLHALVASHGRKLNATHETAVSCASQITSANDQGEEDPLRAELSRLAGFALIYRRGLLQWYSGCDSALRREWSLFGAADLPWGRCFSVPFVPAEYEARALAAAGRAAKDSARDGGGGWKLASRFDAWKRWIVSKGGIADVSLSGGKKGAARLMVPTHRQPAPESKMDVAGDRSDECATVPEPVLSIPSDCFLTAESCGVSSSIVDQSGSSSNSPGNSPSVNAASLEVLFGITHALAVALERCGGENAGDEKNGGKSDDTLMQMAPFVECVAMAPVSSVLLWDDDDDDDDNRREHCDIEVADARRDAFLSGILGASSGAVTRASTTRKALRDAHERWCSLRGSSVSYGSFTRAWCIVQPRSIAVPIDNNDDDKGGDVRMCVVPIPFLPAHSPLADSIVRLGSAKGRSAVVDTKGAVLGGDSVFSSGAWEVTVLNTKHADGGGGGGGATQRPLTVASVDPGESVLMTSEEELIRLGTCTLLNPCDTVIVTVDAGEEMESSMECAVPLWSVAEDHSASGTTVPSKGLIPFVVAEIARQNPSVDPSDPRVAEAAAATAYQLAASVCAPFEESTPEGGLDSDLAVSSDPAIVNTKAGSAAAYRANQRLALFDVMQTADALAGSE